MRASQTKSLVFDVYAPIVRHDGGWIAIADLVTLLGDLGMEEQAVRSSVSRLRGKSLLERQVKDKTVGYALTPRALDILADGDLRIYGHLEPAAIEEGWALITFSVPEERRADRHQLRRRLGLLGFGNLGAGVWIAPRRMLDRATAMVVEIGLEGYTDVFTAHHAAFGELKQLIERCWDIDRMRALYATYLEDFRPVVQHWEHRDAVAESAQAFADFIAAVHDWRRIPYLDPGLPPELLPGDWEGKAAAETFNRLNDLLLDAARSYVADVRAS